MGGVTRNIAEKITYSSSNVIRVIKSRRMRWAEHAACLGLVINEAKF